MRKLKKNLSKLDEPGIMTILAHLNSLAIAILKHQKHLQHFIIINRDLNGRRFAKVKQEAGAKHGFSSVLVGVALLSVIHTWTCN